MRLSVGLLLVHILDHVSDVKSSAVPMDEVSMRDSTEPFTWRTIVDARLAEIALDFGAASPALGRAMAEAALAPGKRFRAMLLLIAGEATGGAGTALIDTACAVELVHTASLVFDDLPCMDDAQTRRGRPTTHLVHGASRAILAGIALVTEAMRLLATARETDEATRARLVAVLAGAVGPVGLSGGQDLDLHAPKHASGIEREQDLKTGALFVAGFEMLGLIQRLNAADRTNLTLLGRGLGRAFQSYDDLLDVEASTGTLGKDTGRDVVGPGPARGVLAVRDLSSAKARYDAQRIEIDAILANCRFDSRPLALYIARVLPISAIRAA
ncbi:polyprenyl synthetase family protein [Paracoccus sp. Z118]|uniref:polyprenyl synthetase family protein n=1 Tax=Paracoccus sp. Z118 TaxID=2851017 RepID=UPI001C2C12F2|nr:polyprenyl synthetase family protein [Paracoccus sp. Z118]